MEKSLNVTTHVFLCLMAHMEKYKTSACLQTKLPLSPSMQLCGTFRCIHQPYQRQKSDQNI